MVHSVLMRVRINVLLLARSGSALVSRGPVALRFTLHGCSLLLRHTLTRPFLYQPTIHSFFTCFTDLDTQATDDINVSETSLDDAKKSFKERHGAMQADLGLLHSKCGKKAIERARPYVKNEQHSTAHHSTPQHTTALPPALQQT